MRFQQCLIGAVCIYAQTAHAGEAPLYAPPAPWVKPADAAPAIAKAKGRL